MDPSIGSESKRKNYLYEKSRSPWSSESTSSSSPLPSANVLTRGNSGGSVGCPAGGNAGRLPQERSVWSGGSNCSLGSSPGASFSTSLTVPDYNSMCPLLNNNQGNTTCQSSTTTKGSRSPSPFNLKARVRRRRQKRMERQSNANSCDDYSKNESSTNLNVGIYGGC